MTTLTVSQVNRYIKSILDESQHLNHIYVSGEISNFKHYPSGHMYFTLKDSSSQLKCVMFSSNNACLKFRPDDRMSVICFGKLSVYERDGTYQLYVTSMQPNGIGSLAIAFEQLKQKLGDKGYFDADIKKPIPKYPNKIGVVTSNNGAAVEDIKNVLSRRFPLAEIDIIPTSVQGEQSAGDVASSVAFADTLGCDVIIVGRGGGSIEDLWAFNTEVVADAVYNCKTPVISAVGHETDFTICDFVSDLRAPTPSAAAELATVDIKDELLRIDGISAYFYDFFEKYIDGEFNKLDKIKNNSPLANTDSFFEKHYKKLDDIKSELLNSFIRVTDNKQKALEINAVMLNAVNPLAVLSRGFSLTCKNENVINSVKSVVNGDEIITRLKDGCIKSMVTEVGYDG